MNEIRFGRYAGIANNAGDEILTLPAAWAVTVLYIHNQGCTPVFSTSVARSLASFWTVRVVFAGCVREREKRKADDQKEEKEEQEEVASEKRAESVDGRVQKLLGPPVTG